MTEFGNLALIDQDAGEENGVAVPLPGVRKGEQKSPAWPSPTALVALLLPLWGCNMGSACFYIGTSFWNLECLGWPRGRGPCVFAPQAGPPGRPSQLPQVRKLERLSVVFPWTSQTHLGWAETPGPEKLSAGQRMPSGARALRPVP